MSRKNCPKCDESFYVGTVRDYNRYVHHLEMHLEGNTDEQSGESIPDDLLDDNEY